MNRLIATVISLLPLLVPASAARSHAAETASFRAFALSDGMSGLRYDFKGRSISLDLAPSVFSPPYQCPANGTLSLYREVRSPEGKTKRVPVSEMVFGPGGPWLLFLSRVPDPDAPGRSRVAGRAFDQSWESHPSSMVKIFSFCSTPVMLQVGQRTISLAPSGSEIVPYPVENSRLWLKAASREGDAWRLGLSQPQRLHEGTRSTWILLNSPFSEEDPDTHRLFVRKLVENAPASR